MFAGKARRRKVKLKHEIELNIPSTPKRKYEYIG
jgi:hypothetical protein